MIRVRWNQFIGLIFLVLGVISETFKIAWANYICIMIVVLCLCWRLDEEIKQEQAEPESHSDKQLTEMLERKFPQLKQEDTNPVKEVKKLSRLYQKGDKT